MIHVEWKYVKYFTIKWFGCFRSIVKQFHCIIYTFFSTFSLIVVFFFIFYFYNFEHIIIDKINSKKSAFKTSFSHSYVHKVGKQFSICFFQFLVTINFATFYTKLAKFILFFLYSLSTFWFVLRNQVWCVCLCAYMVIFSHWKSKLESFFFSNMIQRNTNVYLKF